MVDEELNPPRLLVCSMSAKSEVLCRRSPSFLECKDDEVMMIASSKAYHPRTVYG